MTTDQITAYYELRLGRSIRNGRQLMYLCGLHADRNPSLSVDPENGTWFCHACKVGGTPADLELRLSPGMSKRQAAAAVAEAVGAPVPRLDFDAGELVATYVYRDEHGKPLFESRRYHTAKGKRFEIWHYEGEKPVRGLGNARQVPYRLPELIVARQVVVVEGEKAAERLRAVLGDPGANSVGVTTSAMGAGNWRDEFAPFFAGRDVAILPDNDEPGAKHAQQVARSVAKFATAVKVVDLQGLPVKGDIVDFLDSGGTVDQLRAAIKAAPPWKRDETAAAALTLPEWQFCATAPESIEWLVEGVIQVGANGVIAADPKVGKSVLAVDLLLALASGQPWLGFRCREAVGMLISREDNPALTAWRLRHLAKARGIDPRDRIFINSRQQSKRFMLDVPGDLLDMKAEVAARKPDILILDVLNRLHDQEENDQGNMRAVLEAAQELAWSPRCAVGVVHHFRKPQMGDAGGLTGRLRGSSAISGWFEWMVGLSMVDWHARRRRAEFEIKAAQAPDAVEFVIESDDGAGTMGVRMAEAAQEARPWAN